MLNVNVGVDSNNIQAAPYQPLHFNMLLVLHVGAIVDQYICLLL